MAEFCLKCWNELNDTNDSYEKYIFSTDLELCEGCEKWKHVIISKHKGKYFRKL